MERISANQILFLMHGYDLKSYRLRPTAELKALSESGMFRMTVNGGIATIPVKGPINRGDGYLGETDLNDVVANCQRAMNDPSISGVIMKFDTPGGTASGCAHAAATVAALSAAKPTIAHCDMCCSAGMYLASQTRKTFATSDAIVGSIGTTMELVDASAMYEKMGVKFHVIDTGKYKNIGNPTQPVTDEDKAYAQVIVDDLFDGFVKSVAKGRNISQQKVRDMEAKIYIGQKAMDVGLIDGVCSMNDCYSMVSKLAAKSGGMRNQMNVNKLALVQAKAKIFAK